VRGFVLFLLLVSFLLWVWGLKRAGTLFQVRIRNGKITGSRGNIPADLYAAIEDIIENAHVMNGTIRAVTRDGQPVLQFEGELSAGTQQQMRNVIGQFTASQVRSGRKH